MVGVLVGFGRVVVHTSPSTSLEIMCGPFTPYMSLVSKLSSSSIINHHVKTCQQHIIKSINIMVNKSTQISHSLTQSRVQGFRRCLCILQVKNPAHSNKLSQYHLYTTIVKHLVINHNASSSRISVLSS
jgi:hypothetical protein